MPWLPVPCERENPICDLSENEFSFLEVEMQFLKLKGAATENQHESILSRCGSELTRVDVSNR
jgi:hypothetical protein